MGNAKNEKRKQDLIEKMKKDRGYLPTAWAYLAEKDVDFIEAYNTLYDRGLNDGTALPAKTRELIAMGILAYRGLENSVYEHLMRALRLGATKKEVLEAIETMIIPGGAPTFGTGLRALMRVEADDKPE